MLSAGSRSAMQQHHLGMSGVHVVDHVTKRWMQLEPRPLTLRLELREAG